MIRSIAILMMLLLTVTGCTLMGLSGPMGRQPIMMCPVPPALSIEKIDADSYRVTAEDMRLLLKYITDLEYASGCR